MVLIINVLTESLETTFNSQPCMIPGIAYSIACLHL